jgi:riboflavin synthase
MRGSKGKVSKGVIVFTGIVEGTGRVHSIRRTGRAATFVFNGGTTGKKLKVGDSVAVNGTCLTVVEKRDVLFGVQVVEETMKKTNLGLLKVGDRVNLELPLRASDRLGGHIVLGHVDGIGRITTIKTLKKSWMFWIKMPGRFGRYLIPTGSVAVDGVSLTVARLKDSTIGIAIIPHTMRKTVFGHRKVGDVVNLEFDVLGKYVERLFQPKARRRG